MRSNRIGTTDLVASEVGFGCFGIGGTVPGSDNSYGPTDDATSIRAVHAALDLGCTFFDTADVYGHGHSEAVLGRALAQWPGGGAATVTTKVGGRFDGGRTTIDFSPSYIRSAIDASLRRLGRECVDLYLLHNPSVEVIRAGEVFTALDALVVAGKIRWYGVSVHDRHEAAACLRVAGVSALQVPYNLLSLADPASSMATVFRDARAAGVGLIARQVLAAGFLSGRHRSGTEYDPSDLRAGWPADRRRAFVALAERLRPYVSDRATMAQLALRFVLDEPSIDVALVGVKSRDQAREDFAAASLDSFAVLCTPATSSSHDPAPHRG